VEEVGAEEAAEEVFGVAGAFAFAFAAFILAGGGALKSGTGGRSFARFRLGRPA